MRTAFSTALVAGLSLAGAALAENDRDLESVYISRLDCQRLVPHLARPDVAYRPGVDVRGEHVVPADVDRRPPLRLPETFAFDITVDFCERVDPATGHRLCRTTVPSVIGPVEKERYGAEAVIGTITVARDGRSVFLNGVALTDEPAALVRAACRRRLDRHWRPDAD